MAESSSVKRKKAATNLAPLTAPGGRPCALIRGGFALELTLCGFYFEIRDLARFYWRTLPLQVVFLEFRELILANEP
jgi:hypothetical protein